jgi:molybdenum cofactor cytidylyltransferase
VSGDIAALVLAAGASSRMQGPNKLLCEIDGVRLVERALRAVVQSSCSRVVVVTGWQADQVEAAVARVAAHKPVTVVRNPDYQHGISGSLRCALAALPQAVDGALIQLADMPWIEATHVDRLIDAFDPRQPLVVAPVRNGRRGHPVLWPKQYFSAIAALSGDVGARQLLERAGCDVHAVAFDTDAIFDDIDTPVELVRARNR